MLKNKESGSIFKGKEKEDTTQMLKNKETASIFMNKMDFSPHLAKRLEKKKKTGDVDPDYATYLEDMMEMQNKQVLEEHGVEPKLAEYLLRKSNEKMQMFAEFGMIQEQGEEQHHSEEELDDIQMNMLKDDEQGELLFRGPAEVNNTENKYFDRYCKFGNDMHLNEDQQAFLDGFCEQNAKGYMKYYVQKMTHSCVVPGKCKMTIAAKFSKRYLHKYLETPIMIPLQSNASQDKFTMKMKVGPGSNSVTITTGWGKALKAYKIEMHSMVLFNFGLDAKGKLDLEMVPIPAFN